MLRSLARASSRSWAVITTVSTIALITASVPPPSSRREITTRTNAHRYPHHPVSYEDYLGGQ
ncbi:UNVERIFIED_ORG: hypothetical protein FHR35_009209 [Microbispora rosea subsp. rosea]